MTLADLVPVGLSLGEVVALFGVSFFGGLLSVVAGVGGGILMLAALASVVPPAALIPLHGIVQIGSNIGRILVLLRHVVWRILPAFFAGAVIGAVLGGATAVNLPPDVVRLAVGLFILWSLVARPPAFLKRHGWLNGVISSYLTMFVGASAPFVLVYVKAQELGRMGQVSTHAMLMTSQHILKTIIFGFLGFAYGPWIGFVVGLVACGFVGTLIGRFVLGRTSDTRFKVIVNAVLAVVALRLIWVAARALFFSAP